MDILRDPIWQFIGAVFALLAFILSLIVEWPKVKSQFGNRSSTPKYLPKIINGFLGGFASGLIGGYVFSLLFNEIGYAIDAIRRYEDYSIEDILFWGVGWGIAGIFFSMLNLKKSVSLRESVNGGVLGSLMAMPVGLLIGYFVAEFMGVSNSFAVTIEISSSVGASVSMFLFGFIYGGFMKKVAKFLFGNWIIDEQNK